MDNLKQQSIHFFQFQKKDVIQRINDYTKFVIVREPMERLLSAFKNKFEAETIDADNFRKAYGPHMMQLTRDKSEIPASGEGIQFWEFMKYIATVNSSFLQEHWALYNNLCFPCIMDYDFIGKYNTIEVDSNYILQEIGAPSHIRFPTFNPTKTKEALSVYLNTVPKDIQNKVKEVFKPDYEIFGYDERT